MAAGAMSAAATAKRTQTPAMVRIRACSVIQGKASAMWPAADSAAARRCPRTSEEVSLVRSTLGSLPARCSALPP